MKFNFKHFKWNFQNFIDSNMKMNFIIYHLVILYQYFIHLFYFNLPMLNIKYLFSLHFINFLFLINYQFIQVNQII